MSKIHGISAIFFNIFFVCFITNHAFANGLVIGVVAPKNGFYAVLGKQIFQAATLLAQETADTILEIEETCMVDDGAKITEQLVKASAIGAVGFLCSGTLEGALPAMQKAHLPALTVSVRSSLLIEDALQHNWPFFRLAPAPSDESDAAVKAIFLHWKGKRIALLEDGSLQGHDLATTIGDKLVARGIKPVLTKVFKPRQDTQLTLIRKLVKEKVTHVFVAGERGDVAIIANDAAKLKAKLTFMIGDTVRNQDKEIALPASVLSICLPEYSTFPSAADIVETFNKAGIKPRGYSLPAWATIQILLEAAKRAKATNSTSAAIIASQTFQTILGPISFTENHGMQLNPFQLLLWNGKDFVKLGKQ